MALPPGAPSRLSTERIQAVAKKRGADSQFSARLDALKRQDQKRPQVGPQSQMTDAGRAERLNAMNAKQKAELDAQVSAKKQETDKKAIQAKKKAGKWQASKQLMGSRPQVEGRPRDENTPGRYRNQEKAQALKKSLQPNARPGRRERKQRG